MATLYSEQVIDQVQSSCDIVEIISSYVPLKRAGRNFKACCPFHHEKTPSFVVNPDKQIFHCFGCSIGGDVFSFLMKYDNMNFPEAVRYLANQANIVLPENTRQASGEDRSLNERLFQIYEVACEFYSARLKHLEMGERARKYLEHRNFMTDDINMFRIGFAPAEWRLLLQFLMQKGFREQELLKSGLFSKSQQGSLYDLFRGRVMFPIMNAQGKVIAFGGRVIGDEMPKYLNSPESPIFQKRKELFALNLAKRAMMSQGDTRHVLIAEGYLDCIRLHANGFTNVIATLGTALTPDHVRILKRYADEAVVMFDGDRAGEQASLRSLDIFLEESMSVKALSFPKGYDPDDFIQKKGREAMTALITSAQDAFDYKLDVLLQRYKKTDSLGLLKITSEFLDTFLRIKSPVLVDRYVKRLALALSVEERSLLSELNRMREKQNSQRNRTTPKQEKIVTIEKGDSFERILASLFLHYPPYAVEFKKQFPNFVFTEERLGEIFNMVHYVLMQVGEKEFSISKVLNRFSDESVKILMSHLLLMNWASCEDRERTFHDCLLKLKKEEQSNELSQVRNQINQAEMSGNEDLVLKYVQHYQALLQKAKETANP